VRYTIADTSGLELCELVCGRLRQQLTELTETLVS